MAEKRASTSDVRHETVLLGDVRMHVAHAGVGPAVILLHGHPTVWRTWRAQIQPLVEAGYHVIAPDQRGYGDTTVPTAVLDYDIEHLMGDVLGLLDHFGLDRAVLVGHDWGALVAWYTAWVHPERVTAVVGISVPFLPRGPLPPTEIWRRTQGDDFYMLWFQEPGVAERQLETDIERAVNGGWTVSRDWREGPIENKYPFRSPEDHDANIASLRRNGWSGPLNWYRNFDRNWELLEPHTGRTLDQPALFIGGVDDQVAGFMPPGIMEGHVTDLRASVLIAGAAHWVHEQFPDETNRAIIGFLADLTEEGRLGLG